MKDIGADAVAETGGGVLALQLRHLLRLLPEPTLQQTSAQDLERRFPVLDLAPLVLAGDHDAGRKVGQAYGGARLVDVLTASAG